MPVRAERNSTRWRLGLAAAAMLALALGLPSGAAGSRRPLRVVGAADGSAWVNVPVAPPRKNGPRTVAVRVPGLPAGVTTLPGTATPTRDQRPGRAAPSTTQASG